MLKRFSNNKWGTRIVRHIAAIALVMTSSAVFAEIGEKSNYESYVYNTPKDEERPKNYKKCTQEEFCKFTAKYLNQIKKVDEADQAILDELITKCVGSKLCPKLNTTDNRVVPYQLYYHELKLILENAKNYLAFLNMTTEKYVHRCLWCQHNNVVLRKPNFG